MKKINKAFTLIGLSLILSSCSLIFPSTTHGSSSSSSTTTSSTGGSTIEGKTKLAYTYSDVYNHSVYANLDSCPTTGDIKLLVIPVWFSDSSKYISTSKKDSVRNDIEAAYFGTNEETGWRSVKTYYEELSSNRVSISGTVSSWYTPGKSSTYYAEDEYSYDETISASDKTVELVIDATNWYFSSNTNDKRTNYDSDNNGNIDGVILIYGAPDYSVLENEDYSNLWAYCFWTGESKNTTNPTPNTFFWASYDFMYGSNTAKTKTGYNYASGDTTHTNIDTHTFIHEMGHVFGAEDYYDYSYRYNPAGGFSMQDYNVGSHDPYTAMAFGWVDPIIPNESTTITIGTFQETKDLILLTPSFNSDYSPFDEYILVELYSPTGLNQLDSTYQYNGRYSGPTSYGIRLWHVDARLTYLKTNSQYEEFSDKNLTTNPKTGTGVYHAFSNTYYSNDAKDYCSVLGESYSNYNILQLIRNSTTATFKTKEVLSDSSLFKEGSSFSMSKYKNQFVKSTKLNSGNSLGWSFNVKSISNGQATIELIKE